MSYTAEVNLICSYCGCNYTIKKEFADRSRGISWSGYIVKSKNSMCSECYNKLLLQKIDKCEQMFALPVIQGKSEKQIAYARKLRYKVITDNIRAIDAFKSMYSDISKLSSEELRAVSKEQYDTVYYTLISNSAKDIIVHLK